MIQARFFEEEEIIPYIQVKNRSTKDRVCRVYVDGKMIGISKIPALGTKEFPARNFKEGSQIIGGA